MLSNLPITMTEKELDKIEKTTLPENQKQYMDELSKKFFKKNFLRRYIRAINGNENLNNKKD